MTDVYTERVNNIYR